MSQPPPSYGYPQQTYPPAAPAGAPGGTEGPAGGRLAALIAGFSGIVPVLLVIGCGVWWLTSSGGGSHDQAAGGVRGGGAAVDAQHRSQGRLIWAAPAPKIPKSDGTDPDPGVWFSGSDIVRTTLSGVTAYDIDTGHQDWSVPAPSGKTCAVSNDAVNDKAAVQYGTRCQNVMLLDISRGTKLWAKPLPSRDGDGSPVEYDHTQIAVSGDVVALAWQDDAVAYRISSGSPLWRLQANSQCTDKGFAGGTRLIAVTDCGYGYANGPYHVAELDPVTGKAQWTWDAPAGTEVTNVLSTDPVVVGIGAGSDLITDAVSIDAGGRTQARIPLDSGTFDIHCPPSDLMPCTDVVVDSGTAYIATAAAQGNATDGSGQVNEVEAIALASGKPKWVSRGDKERALDVFAKDGNQLLAYSPVSYRSPGAIYRIDVSNGSVTPYVRFSAATQTGENDAYGATGEGMGLHWYREHFFMAPQEIYAGGLTPDLIAAFH